jgi:serine/threonine protein kinase
VWCGADIKSLNFLVTSDPLVVKLGDVGEAREIGERPADNGPVRPRTAFWSAPEVGRMQSCMLHRKD